MDHSTNYTNTFILVAPDCPVDCGTLPPNPESVAGLQHALLSQQPYALTSDELLFEVYRQRHPEATREAFFSKSQACLRASPLAKQYGWGLHHDEQSKVALYSVGSQPYEELRERCVTKSAMRNRRSAST